MICHCLSRLDDCLGKHTVIYQILKLEAVCQNHPRPWCVTHTKATKAVDQRGQHSSRDSRQAKKMQKTNKQTYWTTWSQKLAYSGEDLPKVISTHTWLLSMTLFKMRNMVPSLRRINISESWLPQQWEFSDTSLEKGYLRKIKWAGGIRQVLTGFCRTTKVRRSAGSSVDEIFFKSLPLTLLLFSPSLW